MQEIQNPHCVLPISFSQQRFMLFLKIQTQKKKLGIEKRKEEETSSPSPLACEDPAQSISKQEKTRSPLACGAFIGREEPNKCPCNHPPPVQTMSRNEEREREGKR